MSNEDFLVTVKFFLFPVLNVYVHQEHLDLNSVASPENDYSWLRSFWFFSKSAYLAIYPGVQKVWLGATR